MTTKEIINRLEDILKYSIDNCGEHESEVWNADIYALENCIDAINNYNSLINYIQNGGLIYCKYIYDLTYEGVEIVGAKIKYVEQKYIDLEYEKYCDDLEQININEKLSKDNWVKSQINTAFDELKKSIVSDIVIDQIKGIIEFSEMYKHDDADIEALNECIKIINKYNELMRR